MLFENIIFVPCLLSFFKHALYILLRPGLIQKRQRLNLYQYWPYPCISRRRALDPNLETEVNRWNQSSIDHLNHSTTLTNVYSTWPIKIISVLITPTFGEIWYVCNCCWCHGNPWSLPVRARALSVQRRTNHLRSILYL